MDGDQLTLADVERAAELMSESGLPPGPGGLYTLYVHPSSQLARQCNNKVIFGCRIKSGFFKIPTITQ